MHWERLWTSRSEMICRGSSEVIAVSGERPGGPPCLTALQMMTLLLKRVDSGRRHVWLKPCAGACNDDDQPVPSDGGAARTQTDMPSKVGGKSKRKVHFPGTMEAVSSGENHHMISEQTLQVGCLVTICSHILWRELAELKEACERRFQTIEDLLHTLLGMSFSATRTISTQTPAPGSDPSLP